MNYDLLCKIYHYKAKITIEPFVGSNAYEDGVILKIEIGDSHKRLVIPFLEFHRFQSDSNFLSSYIEKVIDEMTAKEG